MKRDCVRRIIASGLLLAEMCRLDYIRELSTFRLTVITRHLNFIFSINENLRWADRKIQILLLVGVVGHIAMAMSFTEGYKSVYVMSGGFVIRMFVITSFHCTVISLTEW